MKRPILVAVVGYIIGIIWGLYFKFSIALLYGCLFLVIASKKVIMYSKSKKHFFTNFESQNLKTINKKIETHKNIKRKFNIYSFSRYFRYLKLILNRKVIITIITFSIISNTIVLLQNQKYNNLYKGITQINLTGVIQQLKSETQYKKVYKIKVINVNKFEKAKNTYLYLNLDKKYNLQYGDKVKVKGEFNEPDVARNYGGFNYKEYLKTLNIYGTVNVSNVEIIEKNNKNKNDLQEKIKQNAVKYLKNDTYSIYLGLILGDTSLIDKEIKEQFRNSNMSHILAVSGMHISYIILGITIFLNKTLGKKKSKIIAIFILVIYCYITGFSPSIIRASIMGIMILVSSLIHRKNDTWTAISLSLFVILIYNPYLITSISLQYTYAGTIGIILFNKNILKILNKGKENTSKIKETIAISLSAQIFILPLTLFHFNTFGIYFLATNFLLSFIIGPIVILGFCFLILLLLDFGIAKFVAVILNVLIKLILLISNISFLPLSKMYIRTPKVFEIVFFYFIVIIFNLIYSAMHKRNPTASNLRVRYMLQVFKYKFKENKKKIQSKFKSNNEIERHNKTRTSQKTNLLQISNKSIAFLLIVILLAFLIICIKRPNSLKIHFVDVGQGDCCFIETPNNKTILIDGGGSEFGSFDVGESTLLPYILDRGYTKVDYIIISHFDTDHVGGLLTILEELKVGKVIICKQGEDSENYRKFKDIVKEKKIPVTIVGANCMEENQLSNTGNLPKIQIEKDLYFDILWPNNSKLISENVLNNNSIVCKLHYKKFSMLFTGDIEKMAEQEILNQYETKQEKANKVKNNIFKSTVLKVAHHGSKSSSIQEFLELIQPKISLIGVGENNKFGHPNDDVINRLENLRFPNI